MPKKKEVKAPPRTRYLSIRMEEDLYQSIVAIAKSYPVTVSTAIRGILKKGVRNAK